MRPSSSIAAIALILAIQRAPADEVPFQTFDIPAQQLDTALGVYNEETGTASLADKNLIAARRSNALKGFLTPQEALKIMLAGTGLSIRYTGVKSFALIPGNAEAGPGSSDERPSLPAREAFYAGLQTKLVEAVCLSKTAAAGSFDLVIQLWLDPWGGVRAVHLAGTLGDPGRDTQLKEDLAKVRVSPPPSVIQQPVTVIFRQNQTDSVRFCENMRGGGRDK